MTRGGRSGGREAWEEGRTYNHTPAETRMHATLAGRGQRGGGRKALPRSLQRLRSTEGWFQNQWWEVSLSRMEPMACCAPMAPPATPTMMMETSHPTLATPDRVLFVGSSFRANTQGKTKTIMATHTAPTRDIMSSKY
eukprot:Sspe_Gene.100500::Locus_75203_Transcript_1_1_Confidence_1.000_Length_502::g.100500::m.100500